MPNAINKFRPKQMVKVEKENENQVIKRKQKVTPRERLLKGSEPVWERLSKTKRCTSNDSEEKKSTIMLLPGGTGRLAPLRTLAPPAAVLPVGLPRRLGCTSTQLDRGSGVYCTQPTRLRVGVTKSYDKPEKKVKKRADPLPVLPIEEKLSYMCMAGRSVRDLLTARSICNSKSSSDASNQSRARSQRTSAHSMRDTLSSESSRYFSQMSDCDLYDLRKYSTVTIPQSRRQSKMLSTQLCDSDVNDERNQPEDDNAISARGSLNSSVKIINNFRGLLRRKQKSMPPDEIDVIKNVVKTDARHCQLKPGDESNNGLMKDILRTQLQEILRQETVVKSALSKLDSNASVALSTGMELEAAGSRELLMEEEMANQQMMHIQSLSEPNVLYATKSILEIEQQRVQDLEEKPKVDVIFKNVPTLEKEIIILRALGEKLEATLKRSTVSKQSALTSTTNMKFNNTSSTVLSTEVTAIVLPPPTVSMTTTTMATSVMLQLCLYEWRSTTEKNVVQQVHLLGLRQMLGIVREFRIAQKTIVELKEEEHRQFYLPVNDAKTELKRTCFTNLKQQPDVLLRHLRPKSANVNFNVLDQDAIFFNSFIFNNPPQSRSHIASALPDTPQCSLASIDYVKRSMENLHEGGDSRPQVVACSSRPLERSEADQPSRPRSSSPLSLSRRISIGDADFLTAPVKPSSDVNIVSESTCKDVTSPQVGTIVRKQHRRLRHASTPMPLHKTLEPKNHLLKTILVGSMQVSIFLLLIIAVTYPEAKC